MSSRYLKFCFVFGVSSFLVLGTQGQPTAHQINKPAQKQPNAVADKEKPKYAPGRFIVKFKSEGPQAVNEDAQYLLESNGKFQDAVSDKSDSLDKLTEKHKVKKAKSVFVERHGLTTADARQKQNNSRQLSKAMRQARSQRAPKDAILPDLSNIYVVEVPAESDIEAIVQEFQSDPHVEYAQPDYIAETNMVPNDPYYSSIGSWGQTYDDLWGLKNIQAEQAWDTTQGEGVVVAVVDTGLDYNHPDIAANVWTNPGEIANNNIDDDGNGKVDDVRGWDFIGHDAYYPAPDNDPMDAHGHGTHVSGTIAAVGNNNLGIIGVAPKSKIMPLKGLDDGGSGYISDLADAIVYAAQNGADVISNSWGCAGGCPINPVAEDAIRTAYGLGAVVVFAAGNDSADVSNYSPQNMTNPKPVVVSAITQDDMPAYFTNYGALVDVAAPGGNGSSDPYNVLSLLAANSYYSQKLTTYIVGSNYLRVAGTSMACPHVSGLAALVIANRPSFTNGEVRQVLMLSTDDVSSIGRDLYTGAGRINATRALLVESIPKIEARIITPASPSSYNQQQMSTVAVIGTAKGEDFKQYELFYGHGIAPTAWIALGSPVPTIVENGSLGTWLINDLSVGTYLLRLVVHSLDGRTIEELAQVGIENVRQISLNPTYSIVSKPAISGDRIVWEDGRNWNVSRNDIYLYDLSTNTEQQITASPYDEVSPAISGNRIIWRGWRDWENGADIYLYDLSTNTERQITNDSNDQVSPVIDGDRIAWLDDRHFEVWVANWAIYLYDLAVNAESRVTGPDAIPYSDLFLLDKNLNVSGGRIVWADGRNYQMSTEKISAEDIYLYDLFSNTERQITGWLPIPVELQHQYAPAISGDRIVWEDWRNGNLDIYLYDLATNTERQITTDRNDQVRPAIAGDLIVWEDWRNGNCDIYLYDLATNTEHRITTNLWGDSFPAVSGKKIVWIREDPIDGDDNFTPRIYMHEFNRPPDLASIGDKTVNEGQLLTFTVFASDMDGDALTYSASGLPAGAVFDAATQVFSWTPSFTQSGSYSVTFDVSDGTFSVSETITITVVDVPMPDLVMTQISGPASAATGTKVDLVNTVKNKGVSSAGSFYVGFYLSTDAVITTSDTYLGRRSVSGLAAGAKKSATTSVMIPAALAAGTYYIGAIADCNNARAETDETNNALAGNTITLTIGADLVVSAINGPASTTRGTSVSLADTVTNQGTGSSGSSYVGFYLSTDAKITKADTRIGRRFVSALAAGASSSATTNVTIPATAPVGTYYIGAIADYTNTAKENNETNNARAGNTISIQ